MYLSDYHFHTHLSFDGTSSLSEMVKSANEKGINEICVTDHYECNRNSFLKLNTDINTMRNEFYKAVATNKTDTKLIFGIELGQPAGNLYQAQSALMNGGFDFVLASVHCINNGDTCLSRIDYKDEEKANEAIKAYYDITEEIVKWGNFDALAHFNIYMRYAARQGVTINTQKYFSRMEKIFKIMAKEGKGLEINATSFYQPLASPLPTIEVLKLFKECGGEVITLGSDAHEMANIGRGLDAARKLALDAGFTKKALFSQRNVSFTNL